MAGLVSRPVRRHGEGEEPPAQDPDITGIEPPAALPGAAVTLRGSAFGRQVPTSRVTFKLNAPDLPQVAAGILAWAEDTVRVQVPAMSALGAAGKASVQLSTAHGESTISFVVRDAQPPAIRSLVPASALPGAELRITGDRLCVAATPGQGVSFGAVMIPVISWTRQQVRVSVPDPASVGGVGPQPVRVHTPWGVSAPALFTIAEPPTITTISPAIGAPDSAVTISGSGFGAQDGISAVELRGRAADTGQLLVTPMEVVSWAPNQIRVIVPGLGALKESGDKELVVVTSLARSAPGTFQLRDVGSVTSWTRIEPHARTDDPELGLRLGLRAELADPLWLISRQWVLGELTGEDAASPVTVRVDGEAAPLSRWRPGRGGVPADLPAGVPLEALAEGEPTFPASGSSQSFADRRLAAETGLAFLRLLDRHVRPPAQAQMYRRQYLRRYPLALAGDQERAACDPAAAGFLALVAGRVPDGALLRAALRQALPPERGGAGRLPADPPVAPGDEAAVMAAVADWFSWCETLVSGSAAAEAAWQAERLEYSFAVAATTSAGEVVLDAPGYAGGRLDWHAFRRGAGSLGTGPDGRPAPTPIALTIVPAPVSYRGMPAARWWELEDAAVDFGLVDAGPAFLPAHDASAGVLDPPGAHLRRRLTPARPRRLAAPVARRVADGDPSARADPGARGACAAPVGQRSPARRHPGHPDLAARPRRRRPGAPVGRSAKARDDARVVVLAPLRRRAR